MTMVIDITGILEERAAEQEIQEQKEYFMWLAGLLSKSELLLMKEAMENGDEELYRQITEPVIRRQAIIDFNKGVKQ